MRIFRRLALVASLAAASASGAWAHDTMMGGRTSHAMKADRQRLDELVNRMNEATGPAKVDAIAAVVNELIDQRRARMDAMHQRMKERIEEEARESLRSGPEEKGR